MVQRGLEEAGLITCALNGALIKGCFQILAEKRKIFMPAMVLVIHGLFMHFYTNRRLIN